MRIFDLHNDLLTENLNYISELKSYNKTDVITLAVYRNNMSFSKCLSVCDEYKKLKYSFPLAFEDIGYNSLEIDKLLSYSPIYLSLTHNEENFLGYGVNENKPLKKEGVDLVRYLSNYKTCIDVSHLSVKGVYDVLKYSKKVICSHTAFNGVYKHKRNISDDIVKEIILKNGIIGLTFVGYFLCEKNASVYSVIKHIEYYLSKFSSKNLSLGSDFNGTDYLPNRLNNYAQLDNLKNQLLKLNYSENLIEDIFFNNAYRYFYK